MDQAPTAISRRHARALQLVTCLQSGPRFSANELARHFDVSRRTIFRDLNMIRAAGIQIQFDAEHEAYRLAKPATYLAPPGFREEDLAQLVVATHLSPLQHFPKFSVALRESVTKLLSAYPYRVSVSVSRLLHACALHPPTNGFSTRAEEILATVLRAIRIRRQIRIVVPNCDGEMTQTKFSPYQVVASPDEWVVVGRSSVHRRTKSFRLRSIRSVERTEEPYGVPRGFRFRPANGAK
jgi:predicted DNA-binding transcriptional regulator YafY